jgi:hypothetical protein
MKFHRFAVPGLVLCAILMAGCGWSKTYKPYWWDPGYNREVWVIPGGTMDYEATLTSCVKGHWASDDLTFTISTSDGTVIFEKSTLREKDWKDSLRANGKEKGISFEIRVKVPGEQKAGVDLTGKLTGIVLCPKDNKLNNVGNLKGFTEQEISVDETWLIHVVTAEEIRAMKWEDIITTFIVIGAIALFLLLGSLAGKLKTRYRI